MSDYRQLEVWQKAHAVTMEIYALTKSFPIEERFGLVTQMRRAAVSIGANIAEGRGGAEIPNSEGSSESH
jgi:four helix bundle protein